MRRIGAQTLRGCCNRWIQKGGKRYRCGRTSHGGTGYCLDHMHGIKR